MYGVLCGKHNNLIVIDYDIHKLEETSINLQSLKGVHGSSAYIVKTQSGGFHVYHTYEDKFDSWPGTCGIRRYIDIRTTNNYVVGAGSTGYTQVSGNIQKLAPMPDVIFNMLDGDIQSTLEKQTKRKSKKIYEADEQDALVELLEDSRMWRSSGTTRRTTSTAIRSAAVWRVPAVTASTMTITTSTGSWMTWKYM